MVIGQYSYPDVDRLFYIENNHFQGRLFPNMKIAIFHNYMDNIGGAEFVDLTLAKSLNADIYTTNIDKDKIKKMGFSTENVFSIGRIPINAPFKQQAAFNKFRKLNLGKKYDLYIIGGDWAMAGALHNKPNIWYVYSPIREIWDLYEYTRENNVFLFAKPIFDLWVGYHRRMNLKYIKHVDKVVSISHNVERRVEKYFGKKSMVIYPPIDTSKFSCKKDDQKVGGYWLSVNRLISHKRVEIQIKAFAKMPDEKLIIVGCYERSRHFKAYASYIQNIKPDNVEILSWINEDKLISLYANCKGFITTSKDEDFGMAAVEAMASGKPVIAPNEGGYKETIVDGVTGKLIDDIDEEKLIKSIKDIGKKPESYKPACMKQAKRFDTQVFTKGIKELIN